MIQLVESAHPMPSRRPADRIHAVPASRSSLARFIDAVETPVVLIGRDGRVAVMNASAVAFFGGWMGDQLREYIERAARTVIGDRRRDGSRNPSHRIQAGSTEIVVTFVTAGPDIATQDVGAMVLLRRESLCAQAAPLGETGLMRRFGLTVQEARVAVLLADHRPNREIAERLGVSVHTARHHTERVLTKLRIHSRHDVRRVIS